jgi:hypothetical protein
MGFAMVVAIHSTSSSAVVVAASTHWVSTSEAATVASETEGTAFALASMAGSSVGLEELVRM